MKDYKLIIVPFIALIICQILKFIIESLNSGRLEWHRLLNGSGGMPSSHTTFSFSLTALLLFDYGVTSPYFAIALIFSLITSYDAIGVRYESGKQAEAINDLVDDLINKKNAKRSYKTLKEKLGHKPLEVFCGFILGVLISYIFNFYIF